MPLTAEDILKTMSMDPLSITASTLAIIGAIDVSVKCLRKLDGLRKAPAEILDLHSEAFDLHQVLLLVAAVYDEQRRRIASGGQQLPALERSSGTAEVERAVQANLERHFERAALVLADLNRIVCDYSTSLHSGKKLTGRLAALAWIQNGRKKAIVLREQIRDIRLNIVTTLSAKTCAGVESIGLLLSSQSTEQIRVWSHITNTTNIAVDNTARGSSQLVDHLGLPSRRIPISQIPLPTYTATTDSVFTTDNMTKKLMQQSTCTTPAPFRQYSAETNAAAVATAMHNLCVAWCSCYCHQHGHLRSSSILDPIFGNVSIVYGGILSAARPCNEHGCRRRSDKQLRLSYRPPSWLYTHLFQLSMISTPLYGLKLDLKFPRMVGWDAPIWAHAMDGNAYAIQDLFSQGVASPWDVNPIGGSILHYAADHQKFDLCKLLLTYGADPQHEDDVKQTPASLAWDHVLSNKLPPDQEYLVGSLFKSSDYLETRGFTLLHKTVLGLISKDLETELSCSTADINIQDANGRTPLAWASLRGNVESVQLLLSYGADINIANKQGFAPIHEATNVACARALVAKGADVMSCNSWGRTPIHQVCDRGDDIMLLDFLITAGADVNAADATGEVALHTAIVHESIKHARNGHVTRLIRAGAKSNVANLSGDSPLRFAIMFGTHEILEEILKLPYSFQDVKHIFGHTFAHSIARTADVETLGILERVASDIALDLEKTDKAGKSVSDYVQERSEDPETACAFARFADVVTRRSSVAKTAVVVSVNELNDGGEDELEDCVFHDAVELSISNIAC